MMRAAAAGLTLPSRQGQAVDAQGLNYGDSGDDEVTAIVGAAPCPGWPASISAQASDDHQTRRAYSVLMLPIAGVQL